MPDPAWSELLVVDLEWAEVPLDWLLDGSTGMGQFVGINIGEGVVYTNLASGPTPGWSEVPITELSWSEVPITELTWNEVLTNT